MDVLNRTYAWLHDSLRAMSPGARAAAGLLALVGLLTAGYALTRQTAAPGVDLMRGVPLSAGQLPAIEAALAKANLKCEIRDGAIYVPRGQELACMAALADAKALPPNFGDALRQAISEGNPFEDHRQREQRIKSATQDDLALIIRSMPGIETAYVLYDVDGKPGFNKDKIVTATAAVKPVGAAQLDPSRVSSIRHFVSGAIAGLKPENVTVLDLNGRTWSGDILEAGEVEGNRYVSLKRACEQDLRAKILNALSFVPNVTVALNVTIDPQPSPYLKRIDRAPAADKEKRPAAAADVGQRPNMAAALNTAAAGDDDAPANDAGALSDRQSKHFESKDFAAAVNVLARVSVGVPSSYFEKVWRKQNPGPDGQSPRTPDSTELDRLRADESAKIQRHVAQLLPTTNGAPRAVDLVTVTTFPDAVVEPPAGIGQETVVWLGRWWPTLGAIAVALAGFLALRSMFMPVSEAANEPAADAGGAAAADNEAAKIPPPHARRFHDPGEAMREELSELVDRDPDAAANILRTWIGHVG